MKTIILLFVSTVLILSCTNNSENDKIFIELETLQKSTLLLPEISGLEYYKENIVFAHNDGGHSPTLFQLSTEELNPVKKTLINDQSNFDWEDISSDFDHVYLGDFGNNFGDRNSLTIAKIKKSNLSEAGASSENIFFSYGDQESKIASQDHNFDCEAMVHYDKELFLFTKNRGNKKTHLYRLPAEAGTYSIKKLDEFDTDGLVTGASLNKDNSVLALLGYNFRDDGGFDPFIWLFYDFAGNDFFGGKKVRLEISSTNQFEAICFKDYSTLILSHESENSLENAILFTTDIEQYLQ